MKKIIFITILLLGLHFFIASKTVVYGEDLSILEEEIAKLKDSNQQIELEIASTSSFSVISQNIEGEIIASRATVETKLDSVVALRR